MGKEKKNKIIVIDDDYLTLDWLKIILEDFGYNVSTFNNPKKFYENRDQLSADLILLDILMPELPGDKLYKKLKKDERFKNVPVVLISSIIDVDKIAKKFKADGFLQKPLSIEQLEETVKKFVN